jgi:uncharacterized OsmC-like protein
MTSKITYLGNLRTEALHLNSGAKIITDAPLDNNGNGEAFSPTDLVATALGSCALTIMGIAARNHDIDIVGTVVSINKEMASDPRRIGRVEVKITMPANNYSKKDRKILEAAAHGCPVSKSIKEGIEDLTIAWLDDNQ